MIYRSIIDKTSEQLEIHYKHSNILVRYGSLQTDRGSIKQMLMTKLVSLYNELENYIASNEEFKNSLKPLNCIMQNELALKMARYTSLAEVGPMASVAGVFADELLTQVDKYVEWAFIENGGDIALKNTEESVITVFPGNSDIKEKILMTLPAGRWGVASSSGIFGHSLSLGHADLVTVIEENANKADSFATAIANQITPGCEPLEILDNYKDLKAILIIWKDKIWYRGEFDLSFADNVPGTVLR